MSYVAVAGGIVAALGAAAQHKAAQDAARRQQQQIQAELQRQQQFQRQAEQTALQRVEDYQSEPREARQQQIEDQVANDLLQPVQQAQSAMQAQSAVQGNVSQDYTAARAQSQAEQMRSVEELARIMGRITGANRLRQNEALAMMATGQRIDQLKNFSQGSQAVNQLEVQQAGVPNGGLTLVGGLMQTLGSVGLAQGLSSAASGAGSGSFGNVWSGLGDTSTGANGISPLKSGLGLRPSGGIAGLRF